MMNTLKKINENSYFFFNGEALHETILHDELTHWLHRRRLREHIC